MKLTGEWAAVVVPVLLGALAWSWYINDKVDERISTATIRQETSLVKERARIAILEQKVVALDHSKAGSEEFYKLLGQQSEQNARIEGLITTQNVIIERLDKRMQLMENTR